MATTQITPSFSILQPPARNRAFRQIDGTAIPSTLEVALAEGFTPTGHDAGSKGVRGNTETLEGTAAIRQDGLAWLECPVKITVTYDWARLRATQRTSNLEV